jgi:hypothetical protein
MSRDIQRSRTIGSEARTLMGQVGEQCYLALQEQTPENLR